jgi:hypothetical protein
MSATFGPADQESKSSPHVTKEHKVFPSAHKCERAVVPDLCQQVSLVAINSCRDILISLHTCYVRLSVPTNVRLTERLVARKI